MAGVTGLRAIRRLVSYAGGMRYPDGGGLDAAERARREKVRLAAAVSHRGGALRPGGREAVPGVADVGEPVAGAGGLRPGRRWPPRVRARSAGCPGRRSPSWAALDAGLGGCGLPGSVLDPGASRGSGLAAVRGGVHAGGDCRAAAPDRVVRAGPGPAGRGAGRGQGCQVAGGHLAGHKSQLIWWMVAQAEIARVAGRWWAEAAAARGRGVWLQDGRAGWRGGERASCDACRPWGVNPYKSLALGP